MSAVCDQHFERCLSRRQVVEYYSQLHHTGALDSVQAAADTGAGFRSTLFFSRPSVNILSEAVDSQPQSCHHCGVCYKDCRGLTCKTV